MSETRVPVPEQLQASLKYSCRNRCAICSIMNGDCYLFHANAVTLIESFLSESAYPEKYGLSA